MDTSSSQNTGFAACLAGLLALVMLGTVHASIGPPRPPAIAPQVWEATAGGTQTDALIFLKEQADLSAAKGLSVPEERRRYVYDVLRETARRSQAGLRSELDDAGVGYRSFYIVNMIALQGDRALLTRLARRSEVAHIVANPKLRQTLPEPELGALRPQGREGIEWNVERVNADDVWDLGYEGEGVIVAGQDTGYDWDHPALIERYRGFNGITATHDYNWHDAIHDAGSDCGADSPVPCDDNGHGTHTMGTIVGDDGAGNRIGVAPAAQWIGCRNMDEGVGSPATYIECFEFFLAPYPVGGDPFTEGRPSLAPDVINNSWTCPPYEGCDPGTLQAVVENVRAAGILVVASAGNSGSSCSSVQDPPAIYDAAFSVGATDSGDAIAGFSSRGPVTVDGSSRMKPDVSAPGVGVRSSIPGGGYGLSAGTSMAGPHVAGVAALLWSAAPSLKGDVEGTEAIISSTARPRTAAQSCGADGPDAVPNNVYGWGVVDALSAMPSSWLSTSVRARVLDGFPASAVRYTLTMTNVVDLRLTGITISDTLPISTTLAWADGDYQAQGRVVRWEISDMSPGTVMSRSLEVALPPSPSGAALINTYTLSANGPPVSLGEAQINVTVPWRVILFPIFKAKSLEEL